jgi:hypothetical protein
MPSELYDRIVSRRGRIENLIARIPGFKGYQEKQARRTADRMLRDYIAEELQKRVSRLTRLENRILDQHGMGYINATREAKMRLQTYHDKVQTAAPKYDGMFAQIKIDEADLDKIYAFDEAQIRYVDEFDTALDAIETAIDAPDTLRDAVEKLHTVANEAIDAFSLRDEVLTDLSKTLS